MTRKRKQGFLQILKDISSATVGHIIGLRRVIQYKQLQPTRFEDLLVLGQKKLL
jgi:hypothetical protein